MPNWSDRPDAPADPLMISAFEEVVEAVQDDPDFEDVAGITSEEMMNNAKYVLGPVLHTHGPEALVKAYTMGFLVGMHYERKTMERTKP